MNKTKKRFGKMFKGTVFGMACLCSLSSVPFSALMGALPAVGADDLSDAHSISVGAVEGSAQKGKAYTIKTAEYYKGATTSEGTTKVEADNWEASIKTDIEVKYKSTGFEEAITKDGNGGDLIAGTFVPTMVGTYTITYKVEDAGQLYTYDYDVVAEVGEATFNFKDNDTNILPSVYDLSIINKQGYTGQKDVNLPIPELVGSNGQDVLVGEDPIKFYKVGETVQEDDYVIISIDDGNPQSDINKALEVDTDNSTAKIKGEALTTAATHTIYYTYYQNKQFVSSTTRTFDVSQSYYKKSTEANAEAGYDLTAKFQQAAPDSAKIGVEASLPSVTATTSSTNSPASETVNVYYSVKVIKRNADGVYDEETGDVTAATYNKEDNTFTAVEEGNYKFVYTVTDYYGNTPKQELTFFIANVADTISPTVFVYNANQKLEKVDGKTNYVSVEEDVKNETVDRNIVLYAIGANDNAGEEDIKLTRELKDIGGITKFSISDYNDYNLIINYTTGTQFKSDNFAIAQYITATEDEEIFAELVKNKFRIITRDLNIVPGTKDTPFDFGSKQVAKPGEEGYDFETYKQALLDLGYAYLPELSEDYNNFTTQTYSLYYKGEDKSGNKLDNEYIRVRISTSEVEDDAVPTVTLNTPPRATYLPTETITFSGLSLPDAKDSLVKKVVAYRYLDRTGNPTIAVDGSTTLSFTTNPQSAIPGSNKWYASANAHEGANFVVLTPEADGQYKIDLSKMPENAKTSASKVEVFIYGIDDYGNIGFYNSIIQIAGNGDQEAPKLTAITNADNESVKQGGKITLPTLQYTDDLVDYMTSSVRVFYVSEETVTVPDPSGRPEQTKEEVRKVYTEMPSENASSVAQDYINTYTFTAGTFTASYTGSYRAVITVRDANNNTISTFFDYNVSGDTAVEAPVIDNISSETISLDAGEIYNLPAPTLKVTQQGDTKFAGYDNTDDARRAKYYSVVPVSAENSFAKITKTQFSSTASGKYEIKYRVALTQYKTGVEGVEYDKLVVNENGDLVYKKDATTVYYFYPDISKPAEADGKGTLVVYKEVTAGESVTRTLVESGSYSGEGIQDTITKAGIGVKVMETNVQKFKVVDDTDPVLHIDSSEYVNYPTFDAQNIKEIEIKPITATDNSQEINVEKSYIHLTISATDGDTGYDIKMSQWKEQNTSYVYYNNVTGKLMLKLSKQGNYRLDYYAFDNSSNQATTYFTFANGDSKRPEINNVEAILDKAKDEYKLGDQLKLDLSKLELFDEYTSEETLRQNLVVTVTNTTLNKTLDAIDGTQSTYLLDAAGEYRITINTKDTAGWDLLPAKEINISISAANSGNTQTVYQVVGTVLIVVSVLILVGVIGYFIYSKIKLDKELKGTSKRKSKKK